MPFVIPLDFALTAKQKHRLYTRIVLNETLRVNDDGIVHLAFDLFTLSHAETLINRSMAPASRTVYSASRLLK